MNMMFTPVETKRAYDVVYDQIENMILTGELKPGDKLPSERELMVIYSRSHPTIREALRMLESSNYIRVIPGGCAEVCYSNTDSIQDSITELLQFRQVSMKDICAFVKLAEPQFVAQSVQHFTWEDIMGLEELCSEMAEYTHDPVLYSSRMFAFHIQLMKSTHNPLVFVFWNCMGDFWGIENLSRYAAQIQIPDIQDLQDAHHQLIQAIKEKHTDSAVSLIQQCWQKWHLAEDEVR